MSSNNVKGSAENYASYFSDNPQKDENIIPEINISEEQMKQLLDAIEKNNKAEVLSILGISEEELTEVEEERIDSFWKDLCNGFKENFVGNVESGLKEEMLESGGNWISKIVASYINMNCGVRHVGPVSPESFVILDPKVAGKTAAMIRGVSTGLKFGIPVIGGILDYTSMRSEGEEIVDAAIKATLHVGIGIASAKVGSVIGAGIGSIIPGVGTAVGTVVGGVLGYMIGVVITTAGNSLVDTVYDEVKPVVVDAWNATGDWLENVGEEAKDWFADVGNARVSDWNTLGSVMT